LASKVESKLTKTYQPSQKKSFSSSSSSHPTTTKPCANNDGQTKGTANTPISTSNRKKKNCTFHQRPRHSIEECQAWQAQKTKDLLVEQQKINEESEVLLTLPFADAKLMLNKASEKISKGLVEISQPLREVVVQRAMYQSGV
jgi:hypothetical protein